MTRKIPLFVFIIMLALALVLAGLWVYASIFRADTPAEGEAPGFFADGFFPFGRGDDTTRSLQSTSTPDRVVFDETRHERLWQVTTRPVAGATLVERQLSDSEVATRIRYIERTSGHIFETDPDRGTEVQLTNTRVPSLQSAKFIGNGNALVLQYLESDMTSVQTFLARIEDNTGTRATEATTQEPVQQGRFWNFTGRFLPANVISVTGSPDNESVLYVLPASYGARGVRQSIEGGETREVFQHPLSELTVSWPKEDLITLTTFPSHAASGLFFTVTTASGASRLAISGTRALTTLTNPFGTLLLYFASNNNTPTLTAYSLENGGARQLSLVTLPEKCVWSRKEESVVYCAVPNELPAKDMPDSWYKGISHFRDFIWKIDVRTERTDLLLSPNDFDEPYQLDVSTISIDANDRYLLFTNKVDNTLWRVRLGN